jgi:Family of unknown function (DUF6603)
MSDKGTLQTVAEQLALAVEPLQDAVIDLESFQAFLYRLGWEAESLPPSYVDLSSRVAEALDATRALSDGAEADEIAVAFDKIRAVYLAIQQLSDAPAGIDATEFLEEIGERLFELLLVDYFAVEAPAGYNVLKLLDVIQIEDHEETATRPSFLITRFRFEEIPKVINDPGSIPARVYGWGTPDLDFPLIANQVVELLNGLGFPAVVDQVDRELGAAFQSPVAETDAAISAMVRAPLFEFDIAGETFEVALALLEFPGENGHQPGMILQPLIPSQMSSDLDLGGGLKFNVRAGTDITTMLGIIARPDEIFVRYPFQPGTQLPSAGFGLSLTFAPETPKFILGNPSSTRLTLGGLTTGLELDSEAGKLEFKGSFKLVDFILTLSASDQDGFLSELLGRDLTVPLPLAIDWSSRTGLTFSGSTGFAFSSYPHLSLGPINVEEFALAVRSTLEANKPPELAVTAGLGLGGAIGPIGFSIDNIGVRLELIFADGNAGPFDIKTGFKPPTGLGIVVDAGAVTGGGFLSFDEDKGRYVGILQLDVYGIAVKAIGILDTKLPSGANGFSFLIVVSAEFQPIQLGFGFTLNGVGGLMGIHRTIAVDALQAGIRAGTATRFLFPEDPVRDAVQLISDLSTVFPPAQGRFIFGPMALIGWGSPTLIKATIGVILEVPEPIRLVILGQISTTLPSEDAPIVELHLDILGVIDFGQKRMSIDASLHDSHVAAFDFSGDMAMRLSWGPDPNFALAVGGFNPHFQPPAGFPSLKRVTIALGAGDNPRLSLKAYLAVTSNTRQIGALAEIYAEAGGFNVYGWLGFDALIIMSPLSFIVDIDGGIALRRGTSVLAGVTLHATLSGPSPWHAKGKACLSCFFFDICVPFDKTFGEDNQVELPPTNPQPLLVAAVADPRNWSGSLPFGVTQVVSIAAGSTADSFLNPAGALTLRQTVLPLNRTLTKFGATAPAGPNRYDLNTVVLGTDTVEFDTYSDFFAAAEFEEMSDDVKLSRPSFERMGAGLIVGGGAVDHGPAMGTAVSYETIYVDDRFNSRKGLRYFLALDVQLATAIQGAAARSILKQSGFAKFAPEPSAPVKVALNEDRFVVISTDDLGVRDDISSPANKGDAARALADYLVANPGERGRLQVAPLDEAEVPV